MGRVDLCAFQPLNVENRHCSQGGSHPMPDQRIHGAIKSCVDHKLRIRIIAGFGGSDYTISDLGRDVSPKTVKSLKEVRTALETKGMPEQLIEDAVGRLQYQRLIEVTFDDTTSG